jgi:hypothetical protein
MRVHSQRSQKKTNQKNNFSLDEELPFKTHKTERKAKKRKENQRFQNSIRQGNYDFDEDME